MYKMCHKLNQGFSEVPVPVESDPVGDKYHVAEKQLEAIKVNKGTNNNNNFFI